MRNIKLQTRKAGGSAGRAGRSRKTAKRAAGKTLSRASAIGRTIGRASAVGLGALLLVMLCPWQPGETAALDPGQSEFSRAMDAVIYVQSTISLSLANRMNVDVTPRTNGTISTSSSQMAVATNNSTGYGIYMNTANGEQTLKLIGGDDTINPLTSGATTNEGGWTEMNTWGYRLVQDGTVPVGDEALYRAVPATTQQVKNVATSSDANARDTFELSFGVAVDTTIEAGAYANSVVVSVVANPRELKSFGEITFMQEMTSTVCQSMKDLPADDRTGILIDQRDGKRYWVSYLADGNCWMTQNLALDLTKDQVLTDADTNVKTEWIVPTTTETAVPTVSTGDNAGTRSWNVGEYVLATPVKGVTCNSAPAGGSTNNDGYNSLRPNQTFATQCPDFQLVDSTWVYQAAENGTWNNYTGLVAANKTLKTYDSHYLIGNYYQWNTATAGTGVSTANNGNAAGSICPKGWRLPTSAQYQALNTAYKVGDNPAGTNILASAPLSFVRSGSVYTPYGSLRYAGVYGVYWSSTTPSATNAYHLGFNASNVYPAYSSNRYNGFPVRCVAE